MGCLPFCVKIVQSVEDVLHFGVWGHEVRNSEVVGTWLLLETTTWHGHDSSLVYHVHAVEEIRLDVLGLCFFDELLGEVYPWETVHGTFDLCAADIFHVVEGVSEKLSLLSQLAVEGLVLSMVLLNSLV